MDWLGAFAGVPVLWALVACIGAICL